MTASETGETGEMGELSAPPSPHHSTTLHPPTKLVNRSLETVYMGGGARDPVKLLVQKPKQVKSFKTNQSEGGGSASTPPLPAL